MTLSNTEIAEIKKTEDNSELIAYCNHALDLQAESRGVSERIEEVKAELSHLRERFEHLQRSRTATETHIIELRDEIKKIRSTPKPGRKKKHYATKEEKLIESLKELNEEQKEQVSALLNLS